MYQVEAVERPLASKLRLAVVRLSRRLRAQRLADEVSLTQLAALSTLYKCGEMTPSELAARESVQPPSMTRVIASLERLGHVTRRQHPSDGRQALVALTAHGKAYVDEDISVRERWLDERLAALSEEDRETLHRAAEIIERMAGQ